MSFSSRPTEVVTVYLLCIFSSPFDQNLHWIAVRSYYRHSIVIDIALISLIVMCSLKLIVISLLHIYNYIALCIYVLSTGILATARDWQLLVDLEQQLKFPNRIVTTTLRPDVVLLSESTKQVVLLELTVPWEDRLEEAFERKLAKYEGLVSECRQAGWRARCLPIEVGSRGFAARSLCRAFSLLGIDGVRRRRAIYNTTEAAEKASRWL